MGDPVLLTALIVGYATLLLKIWAFVDAWRWSPQAYRDADRLRRWVWLWVLGFAVGLQLWQGFWRPGDDNTGRTLAWMAGIVVIAVYFFDVRPKVKRAAL
ncbi:MAG: DUF2516 family protein [Candidatus Nanopelagicales bacterium]